MFLLLVILKANIFLERFMEKNCKKINQKEFSVKKVIKRKVVKLYVKWKGHHSSFNSWIDKLDIVWMSKYFPELKSSGGRVKVELDLSNYEIKADLKNATGVDTSKIAKNVDLASLEFNVDKLDIDKLKNVPGGFSSLNSKIDKINIGKLETTPVDLTKISDVVENKVVWKTEYNAKIKYVEEKIPDITNLANIAINTTLNVNIN